MKRLTVLRHAKSRSDEESVVDFDRPLNERGWKAARRIGRELRQRHMRFDLAVASPAARVRETLDGLAEGYGEFTFPLRFEPWLYLADAATLLDTVRSLPDDAEHVLLAGHNPGLQRLVLELTADDEKGFRQRLAGKYPTGALAVIALSDWADARGSGTIVELIFPKELA